MSFTPVPSNATVPIRQESHRIYLQRFSSHLAASSSASAAVDAAAAGCIGNGVVRSGNRHEHARVVQDVPPRSPARSTLAISTSSAAVRITDRARVRDVTEILRGKFGLPPSTSPPAAVAMGAPSSAAASHRLSRMRNATSAGSVSPSYVRAGNWSGTFGGGSPIGMTISDESVAKVGEGRGADVLVLVGTMEGPPRGYVRFEHEVEQSVGVDIDVDSHGIVWQPRGNPAADRFASAGPGLDAHASQAIDARAAGGGGSGDVSRSNISPFQSRGVSCASGEAAATNASLPAMSRGRPGPSMSDLSKPRFFENCSSDGGSSSTMERRNFGKGSATPTSAAVLDTFVSSSSPPIDGKGVAIVGGGVGGGKSKNRRQRNSSDRRFKERDPEPVHVVRTLLPHERPLAVRDKMARKMVRLRERAEAEVGWDSSGNREGRGQRKEKKRMSPLPAPALSLRWYFQPCGPAAGGGSGNEGAGGPLSSSPATAVVPETFQSVPGFVDLEGYCTDASEDSDGIDSYGDVATNDGNHDDADSDGDKEEGENGDPSSLTSNDHASNRLLVREGRRIAALGNFADPSLVVSGYLLKRSGNDPNVWRSVFCVLSGDRLWVAGRMRPLYDTAEAAVGGDGNGDGRPMRQRRRCRSRATTGGFAEDEAGGVRSHALSRLRVGRYSSIKLRLSLLVESGTDGGAGESSENSPLSKRLPRAFRICTARGTRHTFRALDAPSLRVWTAAVSEKIAQNRDDGLIELANLIAEEETLARCRRVEDLAVTPLLRWQDEEATSLKTQRTGAGAGAVACNGGRQRLDRHLLDRRSPFAALDVARFGTSVAEYRELRRHVDNAVRPQKNHGAAVVNVRTRIRPAVTSAAASSPSMAHSRDADATAANASVSAFQRAKSEERAAMVFAVWEEARIVASGSAQLLHLLAASQHDVLKYSHRDEVVGVECVEGEFDDGNDRKAELMGIVLTEQKRIHQALGDHWDRMPALSHSKGSSDGTGSGLMLPPDELFDLLLEKFHSAYTLIY